MFRVSISLNNLSSKHVLYRRHNIFLVHLSHHPGNDTMHCHCFFCCCHRILRKQNKNETSQKLICARIWRREKTTKLLIFKAIQLTGKRQHCYLSFFSLRLLLFLSFVCSYPSLNTVFVSFFWPLYSQNMFSYAGFHCYFYFDEWMTFDATTLKWRWKMFSFLSEFHKYMDIGIDSMYRFDSSLLFRCVFVCVCCCCCLLILRYTSYLFSNEMNVTYHRFV